MDFQRRGFRTIRFDRFGYDTWVDIHLHVSVKTCRTVGMSHASNCKTNCNFSTFKEQNDRAPLDAFLW